MSELWGLCRPRRKALAPALHCLYHLPFLAEDRLGAGRHPAVNAYQSESLSFHLEIEELPSYSGKNSA